MSEGLFFIPKITKNGIFTSECFFTLYEKVSMKASEKKEQLQALYHAFRECNNCPYGKQEKNHRVFGAGNLNAKLMFIGEAPGEQEDREKRPFVGRAGQLLNQCMLKAAYSREQIFITNIVKCRPPSNRTPLPEEITPALKQLLDQEITIVNPRVICTLGATAARALLNNQPVTMAKLRGTISTYRGHQLVHTYHPAYLLRNAEALNDFIQDLKLAHQLTQEPI